MEQQLMGPRQVLRQGLMFLDIGVEKRKWTHDKKLTKFKKNYGSHPLALAAQWYDLVHRLDDEELKMTTKEVNRGFKMFLVAHFFLFNYTRNADQLGDRFSMCAEYCSGKHLWIWIERIAALAKHVIYWPNDLNDPDSEKLALSIDGVDKKTWERPHATEFLPFDRRNYTQKHAHGGLKYQITLCAQRQQCVHIFGPVRGGMGDKEMLERSQVLERLGNGKLAVCDRGYIKDAFKTKVAWPNPHDSKLANNLKSRIRLRHETFNGKMSVYATMNQTWRHTDKQHGLAFRAIAVTIQYELDNGVSYLFDP